jgi:shikimate dehydrogenase
MVKRTFSLGLIGYPLVQSLSSRLHTAALQEMGLNGEYRLYPVPPLPQGEKQLAETIAWVRAGKIQGLNVTIPHKQSVLPLLDRLTPQAQAIGAVNTIFSQDEILTGDNTDAAGFFFDLQRVLAELGQPSTARKNLALVLGAGGAARAVVYALWQSGYLVTVAARRPEQAAALVASFKSVRTSGDTKTLQVPGSNLSSMALDATVLGTFLSSQHYPESEIPGTISKILVNASSAGMVPDMESCPWPAELPFPPGSFVYDLVYKPTETVFLRRARDAGLSAVNGLGMLVEQAALALERWTGRSVPRQALWGALSQPEIGGH